MTPSLSSFLRGSECDFSDVPMTAIKSPTAGGDDLNNLNIVTLSPRNRNTV